MVSPASGAAPVVALHLVSGAGRCFSTWNHSSSSETGRPLNEAKGDRPSGGTGPAYRPLSTRAGHQVAAPGSRGRRVSLGASVARVEGPSHVHSRVRLPATAMAQSSHWRRTCAHARASPGARPARRSSVAPVCRAPLPTAERTFGPVAGVASEDPCTWRTRAMARQRPPRVRAIVRTCCFTLRHTNDALARATLPMEDTDDEVVQDAPGSLACSSLPRPARSSARSPPAPLRLRVRLTAPPSRSTPGVPDRHLSPGQRGHRHPYHPTGSRHGTT